MWGVINPNLLLVPLQKKPREGIYYEGSSCAAGKNKDEDQANYETETNLFSYLP
jgi:hypothetical protein